MRDLKQWVDGGEQIIIVAQRLWEELPWEHIHWRIDGIPRRVCTLLRRNGGPTPWQSFLHMYTTCNSILNQIELCCVEESAFKCCPWFAKMPSVRSLSARFPINIQRHKCASNHLFSNPSMLLWEFTNLHEVVFRHYTCIWGIAVSQPFRIMQRTCKLMRLSDSCARANARCCLV